MANKWFEFKQFRIVQERSAMKVGTDGILLGTCVPDANYRHILDVGTGTGLVALMMAQRFADAAIDAIEIDPDTASEADYNFSQSPWNSRLKIHMGDARTLKLVQKYDLIVSNPPYFIDSLKNNCEKRKTARHSDTLTTKELMRLSANTLKPAGRLVVILPWLNHQQAIDEADRHSLYPEKIISVKPRADKPYKRVIIILSSSVNHLTVTEELTIETSVRHQYTDGFISLTNQFYLDK